MVNLQTSQLTDNLMVFWSDISIPIHTLIHLPQLHASKFPVAACGPIYLCFIVLLFCIAVLGCPPGLGLWSTQTSNSSSSSSGSPEATDPSNGGYWHWTNVGCPFWNAWIALLQWAVPNREEISSSTSCWCLVQAWTPWLLTNLHCWSSVLNWWPCC